MIIIILFTLFCCCFFVSFFCAFCGDFLKNKNVLELMI